MTDTEKSTLEARIDELCAEVERLRNQLHDQQDTAEHNFVRNAREYKRVCDENAKLREFATQMAEALGIDSEWKNPYEDCKSPCKLKFGCCACRSKALCPAWARMTELGIEVPE